MHFFSETDFTFLFDPRRIKVSSDQHRKIEVICPCGCGRKHLVLSNNLKRGKGHIHGHQQKWKGNASRGGLSIDKRDGRKSITNRNGLGRTYLSRAIIEASIKRELLPNEVVHHKNFDPTDDRLDNLLLMSTEEHTKLHWKMRKRKE